MFTGKHRGVYEWKVERPISHSFRNWALLLELSFNFKAFINPKNAAGEAIMISEIIRKLLFTLLCLGGPFYVVGWAIVNYPFGITLGGWGSAHTLLGVLTDP